jgi:hypothetical protein
LEQSTIPRTRPAYRPRRVYERGDLGPERLGPTVADMMIAPGFDVVGIPPERERERERETNAIPPKADYRIATMYRMLGVSSSGYRARVKRRPS